MTFLTGLSKLIYFKHSVLASSKLEFHLKRYLKTSWDFYLRKVCRRDSDQASSSITVFGSNLSEKSWMLIANLNLLQEPLVFQEKDFIHCRMSLDCQTDCQFLDLIDFYRFCLFIS